MKTFNINQKETGHSGRVPIHRILLVIILLSIFAQLALLSSCEDDPTNVVTDEDPDQIDPTMTTEEIQEKLISVEDGTILTFKAGTYNLTSTLSIDGKDNLKIKGEGEDKTILNFSGQIEGAEGMKVSNVTNFLIANLTIKETKGDGIKVDHSKGVSFINLSVIWETPLSSENGGYGIYPVLCEEVMIDNCYTKGASDSGIYVGQSTNAVIKNSTAEYNVAGIEIENTIGAEAYDNITTNNAAGLLVMDLQNLSQLGETILIHDNIIKDNNGDNFAPKGNLVALVPAGTGILVLSSRKVEIFDNEIHGNNVAGLGIISFAMIAGMTGNPITDPNYNPFYSDIYVHDNSFAKTDVINTTAQSDIGLFLLQMFQGTPIPDIITDGIFAPGSGANGGFCLNNNENAGFINLDAPNGFTNPSFDPTPHLCEMEPLGSISVDVPTL